MKVTTISLEEEIQELLGRLQSKHLEEFRQQFRQDLEELQKSLKDWESATDLDEKITKVTNDFKKILGDSPLVASPAIYQPFHDLWVTFSGATRIFVGEELVLLADKESELFKSTFNQEIKLFLDVLKALKAEL